MNARATSKGKTKKETKPASGSATSGNRTLSAAKKARKDEFYTQLPDIENELRHYRAQLRGKTILCNCDDPYESNFFKYFALNFNSLGIKKLIATCYVGSPIAGEQLSLLDIKEIAPPVKRAPYKITITEVHDENGDGAIDMTDIAILLKNKKNVLTLLKGDGDFRSAECVALLKQADVVVTNPPFSLFREYVAQLIEHGKEFLIIGNQNAITYKDIFPFVKENRMWLGYGFKRNMAHFIAPHYEDTASDTDHREGMIRVSGVVWYTNLDHNKRHEEIPLYKHYNPAEYPTYDNYDAIEVAKTPEIPVDYLGIMGVPITFLTKYNPDQFEIVGATESEGKGFSAGLWNGEVAQGMVNGEKVYKRLFIRRKQ